MQAKHPLSQCMRIFLQNEQTLKIEVHIAEKF